MAVAHENAFGVIDPLLAFRGIVAGGSRIVLPAAFKRNRQLAGWAELSKQYLGQGIAAFLSGIPGLNKPSDIVDPRRHIHITARGDDDDRVLVHAADLPYEFVLPAREAERTLKAFAFRDRIKSDTKELVLLDDSYHVITADQEREKVAQSTVDFFDKFLALAPAQ